MKGTLVIVLICVGALITFNVLWASAESSSDPHTSNLIVEEYKLIPAKKMHEEALDTGDHAGIPDSVLKKRSKWRTHQYPTEPTDSQIVDEINKSIAHLGYKLIINKENKYYSLYKDNKLLMRNLHEISSISMNESKTRFFFSTRLYNDMKPEDLLALFIDGAFAFLQWNDPHPIGFLKDNMLKLKPLPNKVINNKDSFLEYECYELYLDDTKIYDFCGLASPRAVIQSLFIQNNHWILEYLKADETDTTNKRIPSHSHVIIDGKDLNKAIGATDIFNYFHLKGKPFYFFRDNKGKTRIFYAGANLDYTYDSVMHYLCCSSSVYNPEIFESMISFYAFKNGYLYYVEAGIYE